MDSLRRLAKKGDTALYAIEGEAPHPVQRYLVSTPEGRRICNEPELLGVAFGTALTRAVTRALAVLPDREVIETSPQERVCVVHFLRGGLNFGLRHALHGAYDFNRHSSAFMSSQRERVDGRWKVREDMYRKLRIPEHAVLLMGDVVATGSTIDNGLGVILDHLVDIGSSVRRLVFFTIGCEHLEEILARYDAAYRAAFDEFEGCTAVYLEGRFRLVGAEDELRIGKPGTDLVRRDCLVTPEFALSQYEQKRYPLERCAVYDAGSRAFDIPTYAADVRDYWSGVAAQAEDGMSLVDALEERWPDPWRDDRAALDALVAERWRDVEPDLGDQLWQRARARWTDEFLERGARPEALAEMARARLRHIPDVRREA